MSFGLKPANRIGCCRFHGSKVLRFDVDAFKRLPMVTLAEADKDTPTFLRVADLADAYFLRTLQPDIRVRIGYPAIDDIIRGVAPGGESICRR